MITVGSLTFVALKVVGIMGVSTGAIAGIRYFDSISFEDKFQKGENKDDRIKSNNRSQDRRGISLHDYESKGGLSSRSERARSGSTINR